MKLILKISAFIAIYVSALYYFRTSGYYNYRLLAADLGGIPWLYSTIGLIFGVISAFIIQKEWNKWNDLVDSVKGESSALQELYSWAGRLPEAERLGVQGSVKKYLQIIIAEGWKKTEQGEVSEELEGAIKKLQESVDRAGGGSAAISAISFQLFNNIVRYRENRMRFGSSQMPSILRNTFRLATLLIIFLSPLIAVRDPELAYTFNSGIAVLAFTIYSVVIDLDHPLHPGGWHLTTGDYQKVLNKIEKINN